MHADELAGSECVEQLIHALFRRESITVGVQQRCSEDCAKQAVLPAPWPAGMLMAMMLKQASKQSKLHTNY